MNLGEIQDECGRLLSDANHGRWSLDVLTLRANQAQIEIQGTTSAIQSTEQISTVNNTETYLVDSAVMDITSITFTNSSGEIKRIPGINRQELDAKYPNWRQASPGEPLLYYYDATNRLIHLYPKPDADHAVANGLTLREVQVPPSLVNSSDVPFDGNNQMIPYHFAIIHWVVAQCWMDDGTPESLAKSRFHKTGDISKPGQYELQIKRIQATFNSIEDTQSQIIIQPQGGRIGTWGTPSKAYPLG